MTLVSPNLSAFMSVAETGSVQGAARKLVLTQAAVTMRIKLLEKELGASLFLRSRKGMQLTPSGDRLLEFCQKARELENEILLSVREEKLDQEVRVRLFGPSSVMRSRALPALAKLMPKEPRLLFDLVIDDLDSGVVAVKQGLADFAIVPDHTVNKELEKKELLPEEYVLCVPPAWKSRPIAEILQQERMIDFNETDDLTFKWFENTGWSYKLNPARIFVNNTDAMGNWVSRGVGYCVLAQEFVDLCLPKNSVVVREDAPRWYFHLTLIWMARSQLSPIFQSIVDSLR